MATVPDYIACLEAVLAVCEGAESWALFIWATCSSGHGSVGRAQEFPGSRPFCDPLSSSRPPSWTEFGRLCLASQAKQSKLSLYLSRNPSLLLSLWP